MTAGISIPDVEARGPTKNSRGTATTWCQSPGQRIWSRTFRCSIAPVPLYQEDDEPCQGEYREHDREQCRCHPVMRFGERFSHAEREPHAERKSTNQFSHGLSFLSSSSSHLPRYQERDKLIRRAPKALSPFTSRAGRHASRLGMPSCSNEHGLKITHEAQTSPSSSPEARRRGTTLRR